MKTQMSKVRFLSSGRGNWLYITRVSYYGELDVFVDDWGYSFNSADALSMHIGIARILIPKLKSHYITEIVEMFK